MQEKMQALVGAKITEFRRKMAEVKKIAKSVPNKIKVEVVVERWKHARKRLDSIADTIRDFGTIGGNMLFGSLLAMSPALVPLIAGVVAALAMAGPMMGVIAGSTFALATAFGVAGAAILAFGGIAIPTISKLFDENAKLNAQQKAAREEMEKVKSTWNGITKELEKPVLEAFSEAMRIANKVLKMARPLFESATTAVNNLLDSLNKSLDSAPVKAFFDYMNKSGGPMLETLGKAGGYFIQGIMSMMTAFAPLADSTAQGFLQMSQNLATWANGLSKSEKFQSFVSYVQENMPKVKAIFRDMVAGLVYMFSAFGPLAADMMTGLQNMMARFKEWAKTLSENQQFQQFIGYIRDNGPTILTLISNLVQLLINFGIAIAPMSAKILELVTAFVGWTSNLIKNHPWVGKLIGVIIVLLGVFQALYPIITFAMTLFGGLGKSILKLAGKFLLGAGRMAASWIIAMGPIGWVIAAVIALVALIIWKWDEIKAWTIKIWKKVVSYIAEKAVEIYSKVKGKFDEVVSFLLGLGTTFYKAGKGLIEQIIRGIGAMVGKVVSKVASVAQKIRDYLPFSPAKEGPLSDLNRLDFKGPIMDSISRARRGVQNAMGQLLGGQQLALNTSLGTSDFNAIRHDIGAEVSNFEMPEQAINVYNEWDGEKVISYVERGNAKRSRITDGFYGK